jgi:hypothetical protein
VRIFRNVRRGTSASDPRPTVGHGVRDPSAGPHGRGRGPEPEDQSIGLPSRSQGSFGPSVGTFDTSARHAWLVMRLVVHDDDAPVRGRSLTVATPVISLLRNIGATSRRSLRYGACGTLPRLLKGRTGSMRQQARIHQDSALEGVGRSALTGDKRSPARRYSPHWKERRDRSRTPYDDGAPGRHLAGQGAAPGHVCGRLQDPSKTLRRSRYSASSISPRANRSSRARVAVLSAGAPGAVDAAGR